MFHQDLVKGIRFCLRSSGSDMSLRFLTSRRRWRKCRAATKIKTWQRSGCSVKKRCKLQES